MTNSNSTRLQRCETQLQDFLAVTLNGVPVDTLTATVVPGKWSAHEQLAHLARYHQIFLQRIDRILTEQAPEFPRYRAEDDPEWPAWTSLPTPQLLVRISSMRAKLMARLRSLTEDDFDRTGVHPKFGAMSLALWLEFFLVHEAHHLYVVLQLVEEGWVALSEIPTLSLAKGREPYRSEQSRGDETLVHTYSTLNLRLTDTVGFPRWCSG